MIHLLCDIPGASQGSFRRFPFLPARLGFHSFFVSRLYRRKSSRKTASSVLGKWSSWKWKPEERCANLCALLIKSKLQRGFDAGVLTTRSHGSAQGLERRG
jgi:hypothetical protein